MSAGVQTTPQPRSPSNASPVRTALLSVSDKDGLVAFAEALSNHGVRILSTGGTARALRDAGLDVTDVEDVTGFPEMLDGRVKTLHPAVHGGILHRRDDASHLDAITEHGIEPIDLVCVSLYPFERTIAKPGVTRDEAIEQIDIGGPAMIRSAAKNAGAVTVVTSKAQYQRVIDDLQQNGGAVSAPLRRSLAAAAFARTAEYDAAIASHLERLESGDADRTLPPTMRMAMCRGELLRYGENPHQQAAVYHTPGATGGLLNAPLLHGKPLSFNNINDAAAAVRLAAALASEDRAAACVVKHANPCGAAIATSVEHAIDRAIAGDPLAAFGGIAASSVTINDAAAERLARKGTFFEVIVAPGFSDGALATLRDRWANVRLIALGDDPNVGSGAIEFRTVPGGVLAQTVDDEPPAPDTWTHAAGPAPSPADLRTAAVLTGVVRALSSNAVCIGGTEGDETHGESASLFGAGAGQMDRLAACKLAVDKAGDRAQGAAAASDAFFPFDDGPRVLIDAGVRLIVHPGGSKRDAETFELCESHGVTCLTTGRRHFRH